MYFTPDGRYAIVVAEARQDLDFRDPHTFALEHRIHVDCAGVDHIDFAATGAYLIATCEYAWPPGPDRPAHADRGRLT